MKKVTALVLMLCFILSGALCYARGVDGTEKKQGEGIPIDQKRIDSSVLIIGHNTTALYGLRFMVSQDSIGKEIFQ